MSAADRLDMRQPDLGKCEARLGIGGAERGQPIDMRDQSGGCARRRQRAVDRQQRDEALAVDAVAETLGQECAQFVEPVGGAVKPAAIACPPPLTSSPAWRAAITAGPSATPGTERPDPLAIPSATATTQAGRW